MVESEAVRPRELLLSPSAEGSNAWSDLSESMLAECCRVGEREVFGSDGGMQMASLT